MSLFEATEDEPIEFRLWPCGVLNVGHGIRFGWLKGPVTGIAIASHTRLGIRENGTLLDPQGDVCDLAIRQLLLGSRRHLQVVVDVPDRFHQQAVFGLTGNNGCPGVASLEQRLAQI